jgi:hypothetical protein
MKKKFYTSLWLAVVLLSATYWLLKSGIMPDLPAMFIGAIVGYAALTWLLFVYLNASLAANPRRFATALMGTTAIKMMTTMAFLGIYLYIDRSQKLVVALGVFAIYIVFNIALLWPFLTNKSTS